jgi:pyruvate formate-lyase activating enzyme-like uncharacterized protein
MDDVDGFFPEVSTYKGVPISAEHISATKICLDAIGKAMEEFTIRYEYCSAKIKDMEKYYHRINKLAN